MTPSTDPRDAVVLWRCDCDGGAAYRRWIPDETEEDSVLDVKYIALPAPAYAALLARGEALEKVAGAARDVLDAFWDMSPLEYAASRGLPGGAMSDAEGERILDRARSALALLAAGRA